MLVFRPCDWPEFRMGSARPGIGRLDRRGVLLESEARETGRLQPLHPDRRGAVDFEARRAGAFLSITTYVSRKPDSPWTPMRIFVLKDKEQAANFEKALDDAGLGVQPDESKRKANGELAATLRDAVGHEELEILK